MRVKLLRISTELLFRMLHGEHPLGYRVVEDEIPEDARLVNVRHGWPNCIDILIESETFEGVEEGDEIPFITPVVLELGTVADGDSDA